MNMKSFNEVEMLGIGEMATHSSATVSAEFVAINSNMTKNVKTTNFRGGMYRLTTNFDAS